MKLNDVAFLVYAPDRDRRNSCDRLRKQKKVKSFESNGNAGAQVVIDVLKKNGVEVGFCSVNTAHKHKIVLVSFTSLYDILAFYKSVALNYDWQAKNRTFLVVGGGFGMQNPTVIRNFIDYAVFGRAENIISSLIDTLLGGKAFEHESVMCLPDIYKVKVAQVDKLYGKESFIGCNNRCLFCHYTWARKNISKSKEYAQGTKTNGINPELLFKNLIKTKKKYGMLRSALDGFSEELRFRYGKRISNKEIKDNIEHIGAFSGISILHLYNIGNFPGEIEEDRQELYSTFYSATPNNRVVVTLFTTPLRPALATPLQYAPVALLPDYSQTPGKKIVEKETLCVMHSIANESPFSQLQTVIVSRATEQSDKIFHAICFSKKLRSLNAAQKVRALQNSFDLTPYLREYEPTEEKHPGWFLESYTTTEKLAQKYNQSREKVMV